MSGESSTSWALRDAWGAAIKEALADAWDEGFTARSNEGMRQRSDPDYPIRRTNPYRKVSS